MDHPLESQRSAAGLTHRAFLQLIGSVVNFALRSLVGLFITPFILLGLGPQLFGIFVVLKQFANVLAAINFRPIDLLKISLGTAQHIADIDRKQRLIGAALYLYFVSLPVPLLMGVLAVAIASSFFGDVAGALFDTRLAFVIVTLGVMIERLLALPGTVLRAQNLDHRAAYAVALGDVFAGALLVLAVKSGLGIVGASAAWVLGLVCSALLRARVALRVLPWIRPQLPKKEEVINHWQLTVRLWASSVTSIPLRASDATLVALVAGPTGAAVFGATAAIVRISEQFVRNIIVAGSVGMVGLCGARDRERVADTRLALYGLVICSFCGAGAALILLNDDFVALWVRTEYYGGFSVTLALVTMSAFALLLDIDGLIVESCLVFSQKSFAQLSSGIFGVGLGVLLSVDHGLVGMLWGLNSGLFVLLLWFNIIVSSEAIPVNRPFYRLIAMPILCTVAIFQICSRYAEAVSATTWLELAFRAVLVASTGALLPLLVVLNTPIGPILIDRAKLIRNRLFLSIRR